MRGCWLEVAKLQDASRLGTRRAGVEKAAGAAGGGMAGANLEEAVGEGPFVQVAAAAVLLQADWRTLPSLELGPLVHRWLEDPAATASLLEKAEHSPRDLVLQLPNLPKWLFRGRKGFRQVIAAVLLFASRHALAVAALGLVPHFPV